jgi:hypothetical protein
MRAEHRRPLVAFVLVALACALVVGQSLRTATLQRLVDDGLPLSVLIPIAPDMLFTIDASGDNGRGGDVPDVGGVVVAVSRPAPPSRPVTTAVATVPISSPAVVVRTVTRSAASGSTPAAGRHNAPARPASTATSRTATVAPARGTPALSPGRTKPVKTVVPPPVVAPPVRTDNEGPSHELDRGQHTAANDTDRQEGHDNGLHKGHQKAHDNGHHKGHQKAHDNGHHKGHQKQHQPQHPKQHQPQHPEQGQKQDQKDHQKPH